MTDPTPTPPPAPTPIPGNWPGLVSELESAMTAIGASVGKLEGEAKAEADRAVSWIREKLQEARNWIDHHHGSAVVGPHVAAAQPVPASPPEQAQEHPGNVEARSSTRRK